MDSRGYTSIPDWMLFLDLDVYETIILAVIYGFSQDGDSVFKGSQSYLAFKAKCSKRKVANALVSLVNKGFVEKSDKKIKGVHLCEYKATTYCMACIGDERGAIGGDERGATNNIDNKNIDIYNTLSNRASSKFKKPSIEEIAAYCTERNNKIDANTFYDYYESNGWIVGRTHMKDWKAAVRSWEKREMPKKQVAPAPRQKESVFEHNLRVMDQMFGTNNHEKYYGKKEVEIDEQ